MELELRRGNALMNLAERLKISPEDVMVFGDQGNDVSMFENPSFKKIAMGNAIEDIKEKQILLQMIMTIMASQKHLKNS